MKIKIHYIILVLIICFKISINYSFAQEGQKIIKAEVILNDIKKGKDINLTNAIIVGKLDFVKSNTLIIESEISIDSSIFINSLKFNKNTVFNKSISFKGNKFQDSVSFTYCRFSDNVNFSDNTIGDITFENSTFDKKLILINTKSKSVNFNNSQFIDSAIFKHSKFEYIDLDRALFSNLVTFYEAEFNNIFIVGTTFKSKAIFKKSVFIGTLRSNNASFKNGVDFSGAVFKKSSEIYLSNFEINNIAYFDSTLFDSDCSFKYGKIDTLVFTNVKIESYLNFDDTEIGIIILNKNSDIYSIYRFNWESYFTRRITFAINNRDSKKWSAKQRTKEINSYNAFVNKMRIFKRIDKRSNQTLYLAKVFENELNDWLKRSLRFVFIQNTIGYGYKYYRLLFWIASIILIIVTILNFKKRINRISVEDERIDKYSTWESQIDNELYGKSKVKLKFIAKRHREFVFNKYKTEHNEFEFFYKKETIFLRDFKTIDSFNYYWSLILTEIDKSSRINFTTYIKKIIDITSTKLDFNPKYNNSKTVDELFGILVHAPRIHLNIPAVFPFIFYQKKEFVDSDISKALDTLKLLEINEQYFAINIVFYQTKRLIQIINESSYRSDFIVLDKTDLWEILSKKNPIKILTEKILNQVDLLAVSPYITAGPAPYKMFFGRVTEEKTLLQSIDKNNFAIVANRKIGKTSLLNRIYEFLKKDENYHVVLFDLQPVMDYRSFYRTVSRKDANFRKEIKNITDIEPLDFYEVVESIKLSKTEQKFVIIFDEVDEILKFDANNKYQLFNTFRELSQRNICKFIFIGSRTLVKSIQDPILPFLIFANPCD